MKTYLVGGAVRDKLLGYPHHENDWVVVGAHPDDMLNLGYKPVGKDFPVFLHPETREEYALARTERKTAPGYQGFSFHTGSDVTLEDDLSRRDLTINAIAEDSDGNLVDPHNGRADIQNRVLRHVSAAFAEDPVRILRVARFAARYHHLGFTLADETLTLMRDMVNAGEVEHLVAERVWKELERALRERDPQQFIETLRNCDALAVIMPEVDNLFGVPQRADYHPEVDTGIHILLSLQQITHLSDDPRLRFATLVHDLGKAETPADVLPRHIGHEHRSLSLIKQFCQRLAVPNEYRNLALFVAEYHTHCHRALELKPKTLYKVIKLSGALKNAQSLEDFLLPCEADARGRTGLENQPYPQPERFRLALKACQSIQARDAQADGFSGKQLGEELERRRIKAIAQAIQNDQ